VTDTYYERLSGQDLSFLAMEDGRAHMHVGMVSIFDAEPLRLADGGIDVDRIMSFVEAQLHETPRLRQKLTWVKGLGHPVWIDDPDFNLHYHVRHTALPPPGDIRQLKRWPDGSCRRNSTAASRCGSTGSSTASRATGSR
jgi:diacylglycerol O-acyltransferase / wax synthase